MDILSLNSDVLREPKSMGAALPALEAREPCPLIEERTERLIQIHQGLLEHLGMALLEENRSLLLLEGY